MTKLQISFLGAVMTAGVVASVIVRNQTQAQLNQREVLGRQQDQQLAELTAEHQRLSNLVDRATATSGTGQAAELERLRARAKDLRSQTQDLANQAQAQRRSQQAKASSAQEEHSPEFYEALHRMAGGKTRDGMNLGLACATYAVDHGN